MPFRQAVRLYKKGIGWSVLLSAAIIMEGYDTILLGNFYALPCEFALSSVLTLASTADPIFSLPEKVRQPDRPSYWRTNHFGVLEIWSF